MTSPVTPRDPTPEALALACKITRVDNPPLKINLYRDIYEYAAEIDRFAEQRVATLEHQLAEADAISDDFRVRLQAAQKEIEQRVAAATAETDAGYDCLAKLLLTCEARRDAAQKVIEAVGPVIQAWNGMKHRLDTVPLNGPMRALRAAYHAERGDR